MEARLDAPDYAVERRYIAMELALARREMENTRHWVPFSYPGLGILRRSDWQKYIHELEKYSRELDRSEQDMREGLLPLIFMVENGHDQPVQNLRVKVAVQDGQVRPKHKSPTRPLRVDGAPNQANTPPLKRSWGFSRRRVKITAHAVEAELSRLEGRDNARLVSQTLHVDARHGARLHFEIVSSRTNDQGEVKLPARAAS